MSKLRERSSNPKYVEDKEKPVYNCPYCSKVFTDNSSWNIHKQLHTSTKVFPCELCPYTCRIRKYLTRHMKYHNLPTDHKCEVCGKAFRFKGKLKCHMRVHTGEKPYKCNVCGKAFSANYTLICHMYTHTDEKPFQCAYCEYACRDSSTLRKHEARHIGASKIYECKKCHKGYECKAKLKAHVEEIHFGVNNRRIPCEQCDKSFKTKQSADNHVKAVHEKAMQCECVICGHVLSNKNNLPQHMRTHVDVRPYTCTYSDCGKKFKVKNDLKKHALIHYPEKQFPCDICGKLFARKIRMVRHLNTHVPKKKSVECDHCGVLFYSKKYLSRHIIRRHGRKRKKYLCDLCDFKTNNKPSLVMHLKHMHTGKRERVCQICNAVFKKHEYLKIHYTRSHKMRFNAGVIQKLESKPIIKIEPIDEENLNEAQPEMELLEIHKEEIAGSLPDLEYSDIKTDFSEDTPGINFNEEAITNEPEKHSDILSKYAVNEMENVENTVGSFSDSDHDTDIASAYSRKVLSEDVSRCLERSNGRDDSEPEMRFDRIYINHVMQSPDRNRIEIMAKNINASKEKFVKKCVDKLILESINRKEAVILEEARKKYNERIEMAINKAKKKEPVNIKYFHYKHFNEINGNHEMKDEGNDETILANEDNDDEEMLGQNKKIKFNTHQCYICFKLFQTKLDLTKHCKDHFDVCNYKLLKKCPFCAYVTNLNIRKHLQLKHKINLIIPYSKITERNTENGSKYVYEVNKDISLEIIPSINNLNKRAYMKIDEDNRTKNTKKIATTKLVRKGTEWVVEKQEFKITDDNILPKFSMNEIIELNLKGNSYVDMLKKLGFLARRRGVRMLYPCEGCDRICHNLSGLVLHNRKHEVNPKPFKPKVWKNRIVKSKTSKNLKDKRKVRKNNRVRIVSKYRKTGSTSDTANDFANIECTGDIGINNGVTTIVSTKNGRRKATKNSRGIVENRFAKPKPIINKHKCDKELIEFYENNIKGGDIEFWQFLKIFNKMGRENIKDFKDLEFRRDFGIHFGENMDLNQSNNHTINIANSNVVCVETSAIQNKTTDKNHKNIMEVTHKVARNVLVQRNKVNKSYRRVLMISKKERQRRNDIKNEMRKRIEESKMLVEA